MVIWKSQELACSFCNVGNLEVLPPPVPVKVAILLSACSFCMLSKHSSSSSSCGQTKTTVLSATLQLLLLQWHSRNAVSAADGDQCAVQQTAKAVAMITKRWSAFLVIMRQQIITRQRCRCWCLSCQAVECCKSSNPGVALWIITCSSCWCTVLQ